MSTLTQFFGGGAPEIVVCEVLVVGGGGAGGLGLSGFTSASGAGGSGQLVWIPTAPLTKGITYTVTIGAGGASSGGFGSTSALGPIEAYGGAGGTDRNNNAVATRNRFNGGGASASVTGGTIRQGSLGGGNFVGTDNFSAYYIGGFDPGTTAASAASGGGGGSGAVGGNATASVGGAGGAGYTLSITGSSVQYAKGGAGQVHTNTSSGTAGGANTGDGGSALGAVNLAGPAGGSGIVIIAYPDTYDAPTALTGTYSTPTRSGYRVYQFTGSGSITL